MVDRLNGPWMVGVGLGHGYVDFGGYVVALTSPGAPRMPSGVETDLQVLRHQPAWIGEGRLDDGTSSVIPGPLWDPRPCPRVMLDIEPLVQVDVEDLAGRGEGLTPSGDDLLSGYVAALG
ncbi:MAG: DUF2877 domain-containing protein, partial [Acidimicrobiales bacterium]